MKGLAVGIALAFSGTLLGQTPATLFDALRWRMIGPFRGGRAITATGVPGDPNTFYFGAVGGGIWKTKNAGVTWTPIFDSQHVASIGAIEVAPSDPKILYAGTGEADIRSDLSSGDGVYKSVDGGVNWTNIGLRDSKQIGRILIHPGNPDIVYVAALGHAYGPNEERGVFRSMDGGRSWQKVLYKGPDVGAVDLAFEPENPHVIYAVLWQARRPPWSQYAPIEGPGTGLYKSTDAGDHWTELTGNGLPASPWHRAAVAVARGTGGRRVYATIDATAGAGLYRSDDSAHTWTRVSDDSRIVSRAWYFSSIAVNPAHPDILYIPNVAIYRSLDGGRNFTVLKGAPGGDDYHYVWIDPTNGSRMIQASDQGVSISVDAGSTWSSWYNQPTAQLYHVITDNQFPYHVYASQQDSGTVVVPSRTDHGGISEYDRWSVGGAESGYIAVDPTDPNIFYVNDTYGTLTRFDKRTSQGQDITPWPAPSVGEIVDRKYRFPWTSPLVFSPIEKGSLYFGSQYVLKTTDGGLNWRQISPDLTGAVAKDKSDTTGEVTVENAKQRGWGVVYTIAPSPLAAGEIWAGSDTGMIHLTRDGGKTWNNVTPKGLSDWSKITHIEASHSNPAEAYAAVDRHRLDDYTPHLFRTRDYGKTWTAITQGIGATSFLNAIREDPARKGLLFAATETAVYASFDDGDHWQSMQFNMPTVSVRDLVIHGDDLVIATHGRSFWVLDDISALREIDAKVAASDAWLYKPATAVRMNPEAFLGTPLPPEIPQAKNPPDGAILDYRLTSGAEDVTLDILDSKNQVVRRFSSKDHPEVSRRPQAIADIWIVPPPVLTANAGMNRFVWDLRYAPPTSDGGGQGARGPQVLPGLYQVRLTVAGRTPYTQPLKVAMDPRSTATPLDLAKQFELGMKVYGDIKKTAEVSRQLAALRRQLAELKSRGSLDAGIASQIASVDADAANITGGAGARRAPGLPSGLGKVQSELNAVAEVVESADRTPPAQAYALYQQATRELAAQDASWRALQSGRLAELNRTLRAQNLPEIDLAAQR